MSKETLEVLARMTDSQVEVRDMVDAWILLTYDIPHTKEGDKARREFLVAAGSIGATHHTDSVYLMPWTTSAEAIALELAHTKGGKVIVWTSKPTDEGMAREITRSYDKGLEPLLDKLNERIDKIIDHAQKKHWKRVNKMLEKTELQVAQLQQAVERRGSLGLSTYFQLIKRRFDTLRG